MKRGLALLTLLAMAAAAEAQFVPRKKPTSPLLQRPSAEELRKAAFPDSSGKSLDGEEISFPQALTGHLSLVFLTSQPEEEYFFETWIPSVRRLEEKFEGFRFYIVPLGSPEGVAGASESWPFVPSTRPGLSPEEHRKVVVPLGAERRAFFQKLAIPPDDTLHIVLVGEEGEIVWHTVGGRTNGKSLELDRQASIATNDGGG